MCVCVLCWFCKCKCKYGRVNVFATTFGAICLFLFVRAVSVIYYSSQTHTNTHTSCGFHFGLFNSYETTDYVRYFERMMFVFLGDLVGLAVGSVCECVKTHQYRNKHCKFASTTIEHTPHHANSERVMHFMHLSLRMCVCANNYENRHGKERTKTAKQICS